MSKRGKFVDEDQTKDIELLSAELAESVHLISGLTENTDITEKLNNELSLNVLSSRKFKIPKGVYLVSAEIIVPSNTVLFGDGLGNTTLKIKDNSSLGTVATHGVLMTENNGSNIIIEGITIDGNQSNQSWVPNGSANYGIAVRSSNTIIKDCECKNVTGNGCGVPVSAVNVLFDGVYSHDNGKKGFHSGEVENIQIKNGYYYNNGIDSGIGIHQGMKKGIISGNHCYNNGTYGIMIGDSLDIPSYDLLVTDNICYGNGITDIFVSGKGNTEDLLKKNAIVSNNICRDKGITVSASKYVDVINNILINANILVQTSFVINIKSNNIVPNPNGTKNTAIKVEGVGLTSTTLTTGSHITIENNTIDCTGITIPYAIESGGHDNVKIIDNKVIGTPTTAHVRLWDKYATSYVKHIGSTRIEADSYSTFNNFNLFTQCTTATRPKKAKVGEPAYDMTIGKPICCKTASVLDASGNVTTPAVWVDGAGVTV